MDNRECLNCGETKVSIKRQGITLCGIEEGYEYRELAHEFPHHRWADWRDGELTRQGVKPEAFDRHRRTPALTFQWIACEDTVHGHRPPSRDDRDMGVVEGQCVMCGKKPDREDGGES